MAYPVSRPYYHGNLVLIGIFEGIICNVTCLFWRRRVENRDTEERREKASVLFCLRRLRPRVITGNNHKPTLYVLCVTMKKGEETQRSGLPVSSYKLLFSPVSAAPKATSKAHRSLVDHSA